MMYLCVHPPPVQPSTLYNSITFLSNDHFKKTEQDNLLLIVLRTVYICQSIKSHDMIVPLMIGFIVNTILTITLQVEKSLIPLCFGVDKTKDRCDMLTLSDVLAINQALPYKYREKWSLLFDSRCVYGDFKQSLFGSMRLVMKLIKASLDYLYATLQELSHSNNYFKLRRQQVFFFQTP